MIEPYKHDCGKCKWVGWYMHPGSNLPANVYLCGQVVIIRHSSEGSDYWSGTAGQIIKSSIYMDPEHEAKYVEAIGERQQGFEQERLLDQVYQEWKEEVRQSWDEATDHCNNTILNKIIEEI
jgi:hypothetical protein